jgi:adenosylcobinamide kinase/adenosylcobinamide-phosphate guanylyltransferase
VNRRVLVLGGARSGKSRHAEGLADVRSGRRLYVATAEPGDSEMQIRIDEHRARRGKSWLTLEEPVYLSELLRKECRPDRFVLVDCITLWISNLMHQGMEVQPAIAELCTLIPRLEGQVLFVSNEVGQGIVPDNELARRFRDEAGFANQQIAEACDEVIFLIAGLPHRLKG